MIRFFRWKHQRRLFQLRHFLLESQRRCRYWLVRDPSRNIIDYVEPVKKNVLLELPDFVREEMSCVEVLRFSPLNFRVHF